MIPITWSQQTTIANHQELLDNYYKHGGAIIQYQRVFSIIIFSQMTPKFEWVPPHKSRCAVGFKHSLWCFIFGWWSITGFFWTAGSIINNLMGGIDVTRALTSPPLLTGQPHLDDSVIHELKVAEKRQQYAFLAFLLLLLLLVYIFIVIPNS